MLLGLVYDNGLRMLEGDLMVGLVEGVLLLLWLSTMARSLVLTILFNFTYIG